MKAQTITDALHAKSDAALKKHIESLLLPLFEEAKNQPYNELRKANSEDWKPFGDDYWIGKAMTNYRDLAFLYLRDVWREKEIHRFITKVEEVHAISEEFIHQQDQ